MSTSLSTSASTTASTSATTTAPPRSLASPYDLGPNSVVRIGFPLPRAATARRHFFVDADHPDANDSNPGTEAEPWLTLDNAETETLPGDTVFVKAGTYAKSHTWENMTGPIAIRVFPGHKVYIGRGDTTGYGIRLSDSSYITLDGFTIDQAGQPIQIWDCDHVVVENCVISNSTQEGIKVGAAFQQGGGSYDCIVRNNYIHHCARVSGLNGEGVYIGNSLGNQGTDGDFTARILVLNNLIHDCDDEGIECKQNTSACIMDGNHIHHTFKQAVYLRGDHGFPTFDPKHIVRNNIVHDIVGPTTQGVGIWAEGGGATIYNNVVYDCEDYGIRVLNASDRGTDLGQIAWPTYMYHNTVYECGRSKFSIPGSNYEAKNNLGLVAANNLDSLPEYFVDAAGRDFRLFVKDSALQIDPGAGIGVDVDILGTKRIIGDMGAYEYTFPGVPQEDQPIPPIPTTTTAPQTVPPISPTIPPVVPEPDVPPEYHIQLQEVTGPG